MIRRFIALVALGSLVPLVFAEDKPVPVLKGWGEAIDRDGDCKFVAETDQLTIEVPGTKHDLSIEAGVTNASRVIRAIDGDFIVQVNVSGNVTHKGGRTSPEYLAYHGGGLVLWVNDQTYVRLERAAIVQMDGVPLHNANFEIRRAGNREIENSHSFVIPDQHTTLRLERRGGKIYGSVSQDGVRWESFEPIVAELPKGVKFGIAAICTSTEAFKAKFSGLEVYKKEEKAGAK